jgi:signal transduction histidine kinase
MADLTGKDSPLTVALQHFSDTDLPLVLISFEGETLWANSSFQTLSDKHAPAPKPPLTLTPEALRTLRLQPAGARIPLSFHYPGTTATALTFEAVALDVGRGDPDTEACLIALLSAPRPEKSTGTNREHIFQEEILATATHDLRNPLGAIFGYADVLLDTAFGSTLQPNQRDIVQRIRSTAARCIELVRNYHALGAVSARAHSVFGSAYRPTELAPIPLAATVRTVIDATWRDIGQPQKLTVELCPNTVEVRIPRLDLERIVTNLLTNAFKYTPQDGEVAVFVRQSDASATIEVRNSPAKIDAELRGRLFQCYARGKNVQEISGSGLGLYIVKKLVEDAGGTIAVESTHDEPSKVSFLVSLPVSVRAHTQSYPEGN